ncbi:hypothetical protein HYALB_00005360 [Hymenoscyphus albidus]|uniref:N-acetyltransferase domain-containing protein n=1 Tax=Hymenoscyphus albidus TaxID=595503 RepID=A0A9N9LJB7_9HELO|nr:hypothetical protein HYALB_00005360 [Hymenoscyphus albidus]
MATATGKPKTSSLRTYSKRVKTSSELPPNKKIRVDDPPNNDNEPYASIVSSPVLKETRETRINISSNQPKPIAEDADAQLPPPKPAPRSSIRSYFKPVSQQPVRDSSISTFKSSDTIEAPTPVSPPSSPPASPSAIPPISESRRPRKKSRRRLTTRNTGSFEKDISDKDGQRATEKTAHEIVGNGEVGTTKKKRAKANLQQTQIDLGQDTILLCPKCGMIFNVTSLDDKKLHDKHCSAKLVSTTSERKSNKSEKEFIWEKNIGDAAHRICVITTSSSKEAKNNAVKVLDFTHEQMGGYQYELSELWSQIPDPKDASKLVPRFKLYVYYIGSHVVGAILTEAYRDGIQIWGGQSRNDEKVVVLDRIWVDTDHRHRGYARQLADTVRQDFEKGREISKDEVGTSELTEFGKAWAKAYFGV